MSCYFESANKKGAKFVIISSGSPKKLKIERYFVIDNSKVEKNLKKIIKSREKCSKKKNCSKGLKIKMVESPKGFHQLALSDVSKPKLSCSVKGKGFFPEIHQIEWVGHYWNGSQGWMR